MPRIRAAALDDSKGSVASASLAPLSAGEWHDVFSAELRKVIYRFGVLEKAGQALHRFSGGVFLDDDSRAPIAEAFDGLLFCRPDNLDILERRSARLELRKQILQKAFRSVSEGDHQSLVCHALEVSLASPSSIGVSNRNALGLSRTRYEFPMNSRIDIACSLGLIGRFQAKASLGSTFDEHAISEDLATLGRRLLEDDIVGGHLSLDPSECNIDGRLRGFDVATLLPYDPTHSRIKTVRQLVRYGREGDLERVVTENSQLIGQRVELGDCWVTVGPVEVRMRDGKVNKLWEREIEPHEISMLPVWIKEKLKIVVQIDKKPGAQRGKAWKNKPVDVVTFYKAISRGYWFEQMSE